MESKSIIAIVLLVFVGLFIWGYAGKGVGAGATTASVQETSETNPASKSALTVPETLHDFGTISMKNRTVTKDFTVTNPTDKDITVETVLTSCMCTTAFLVTAEGKTKGPFGMAGMGYVPPANETIKPGENRTVRVVYDPNAHGPAGVGRTVRFITLTDDSGGTLELEIRALVTP